MRHCIDRLRDVKITNQVEAKADTALYQASVDDVSDHSLISRAASNQRQTRGIPVLLTFVLTRLA
jgi:hypothetical protein